MIYSIIVELLLQARNYIQSLPPLKKKNFKDVFRGANPLGKYNKIW